MKVYIASDHAGFKLKNFLINELQNSSRSGDGGMSGYELINSGPKEYDSSDDYPLTTQGALKNVSADPASKGILICKNGVGVTIFANRFKNVRAGLSWTPEHAESHRHDDNTNVLTLPAEFISKEKAVLIARKWLETEFQEEERHKRRLKQIEEFSLSQLRSQPQSQ